MIVLVNGAFGIGKTAVARALRARLSGSMLVDPEHIGIVLQRAARFVGRTVDDFQDLVLWRKLTVVHLRVARLAARHLIVPMAFSNPAYLDEIRLGAAKVDSALYHFCLVAPEHVVHQRLKARGADPVTHAWEFRRASECCALHPQDIFATHIPAVDASPDTIAAAMLTQIRRGDAAS